jgi:PAS domain S-box-containing protein
MFDHLPMGLYRCSPEGEFLDADPATLASLYASTFYVSAEDEETFKARLREFGVVRGFETHLRAVDGRDIRLRNTARIHRDTDGKIGYVEGVVEDVTRAWRSIGNHREAARYQALYECDHMGILTLDGSGDIQDANPAFRALSGYEEEDLSSVSYAALFEWKEEAETLEKIRQLSAGSPAIQENLRKLRMKDGSIRTVNSPSVLTKDGDLEPDHVPVVLEATPTD